MMNVYTAPGIPKKSVELYVRQVIYKQKGHPETIIRIVSEFSNIPVLTLKSRDKHNPVAEARHICMYFLRSMTSLSLTGIGSIFHRDHSTVIANLMRVEDLIDTEEEFRIKIATLREKILAEHE